MRSGVARLARVLCYSSVIDPAHFTVAKVTQTFGFRLLLPDILKWGVKIRSM